MLDTKTPTKVPARDADATKARILAAAKKEFALLGLGGARVDSIAEKASANKRMIYYHFGSKEELFVAVLEHAYLDIRRAEHKLHLDDLPPDEAMVTLIEFTWNYYLENPEFIRLVNSANLHKGRHLTGLENVREASRQYISMIQRLLDRGAKEGLFREGINAKQLNITLAAIGYYYLNNRFSGEILFEQEYMSKQALDERLAFNIDTVMRMIKA